MIAAPFSLLQLPNTSNAAKKIPSVTHKNNAYIGISHSSISVLSLQPPQEIDAFSVSPGTEITAICILTDENGQEKIFFATKERKRYFLKMVNGPSIPVSSPIEYIYSHGSSLIAVYSNPNIEAYSSDLTFKWSTKDFGMSDEKVVFSCLVNDEAVGIVLQKQSVYAFLTLEIRSGSCAQTNRVEVQLPSTVVSQWSFADGTLFWSQGALVKQFDFKTGSELTTIELHTAVGSLLALSGINICVVLEDKTMIIIDTKHSARLASLKLDSLVSLITYVPDAECMLAANDTENNLLGFGITPSKGSLLESIGHGMESTSEWQFGFADIFNFAGSIKDVRKQARSRIDNATKGTRTVLLDFKKFFEAGDEEKCTQVVEWLKKPSADWPIDQVATEELKVYEENDRQVDKDLVKSMCALVFGLDKQEASPGYKLSSPVLGIYLITHPLFPVNELHFYNIFTVVERHPQLYRQAVVSLKGAHAKNIVEALCNPSEETFNDAVERLNDEFSYTQIVEGIRQAFNNHQQKVSGLNKLITRLCGHPSGMQLISPFIDTIGLHSWDPKLVASLESRTQRQVDYLTAANKVNSTMTELLKSVDIDIRAPILSRSEFKRKSRKGQENERRKEVKEIPRYSIETLVFTE